MGGSLGRKCRNRVRLSGTGSGRTDSLSGRVKRRFLGVCTIEGHSGNVMKTLSVTEDGSVDLLINGPDLLKQPERVGTSMHSGDSR